MMNYIVDNGIWRKVHMKGRSDCEFIESPSNHMQIRYQLLACTNNVTFFWALSDIVLIL